MRIERICKKYFEILSTNQRRQDLVGLECCLVTESETKGLLQS
jgi:hypothetical protein